MQQLLSAKIKSYIKILELDCFLEDYCSYGMSVTFAGVSVISKIQPSFDETPKLKPNLAEISDDLRSPHLETTQSCWDGKEKGKVC